MNGRPCTSARMAATVSKFTTNPAALSWDTPTLIPMI